VPGPRERQNSFLEPLELEELDAADSSRMEPDPDVFERVTAVPGDLPEDTATRATTPVEDDSISGLFERAAPGAEPPPEPHPGSDQPPVLSAPPSAAKRASRRNSRPPRTPSRPALERASRRPSPPPQPALELDLDADPAPEPAHRPDALEADLPLSDPSRAAFTLSPPSSSNDPEVLAMKDRYATGDFSGALIVAEGILSADPQHEEALRCQLRCTEVLAQMYLARLGSLQQVVRVALSGDQIRWLSLDHRAGFLLSLVDGESSIETLLDISGMQRIEALRILFGLLDQRVIALSEGH
jgi:hypothetical protein